MTRDAQNETTAVAGCGCDAFVEAREQLFVEQRDGHFYLADRQGPVGGGWSVLYGPEIAFCPFCGTSLAPDVDAAGP